MPSFGDWVVVVDWRRSPRFVVHRGGLEDPPTARCQGFVVLADGVFHEPVPPSELLRRYRSGHSSWKQRLRGRFNVVVWDEEAGMLEAIRDAMGMWPLFFSATDTRTVVSPVLDLVLEHMDGTARLDPLSVVGEVFLGAANHPAQTIFHRVGRVPAGHALKAGKAGTDIESWYRPTPASFDPGRIHDEFADLLESAIDRCLREGPSAVMLSGGMDSATVAAAAARRAHHRAEPPPIALSILNPTPQANEEAMQRHVAGALGLRLHASPPAALAPEGRILRDSLTLSSTSPWPVGTTMAAMDRLAANAVSEGCTAVLTGDGGDEWLMPFPSWSAERLVRADFGALRRLGSAWRYVDPNLKPKQALRSVLWDWSARPIIRQLAVRLIESAAPRSWSAMRHQRYRLRLPAWLLPDEGARGELVTWLLDREESAPPWRSHRSQKRNLPSATFSSYLMEDNFARGRRLGVEVLAPLWDLDLVEFLRSIPAATLVDGGRAKALAVRYLEAELPDASKWPAKTVADSIVVAAARVELPALYEQLGGLQILASSGVVDGPAVARALDQWNDREVSDSDVVNLWEAVALESFLRTRLHSAT